MKHALALVLAGSTLAVASDAPATAATVAAHAFDFGADGVADDAENGGLLWSVSDDSSSDDSSGDDDCDPVTDPACAGQGNAAPAGTVAPPKNGLFTDGTAPVVKSN